MGGPDDFEEAILDAVVQGLLAAPLLALAYGAAVRHRVAFGPGCRKASKIGDNTPDGSVDPLECGEQREANDCHQAS